MIVADTSALISLATAEVIDHVVLEFDVYTTDTVLDELDATAEYDDPHGTAAQRVLEHRSQLTVHTVSAEQYQSSRVDAGEASCVALARNLEADFLLTDDFRALPELRPLVSGQVALSPIVLRALVKRAVLENETARDRLEQLAMTRDWLGAPIYEHARQLFDT